MTPRTNKKDISTQTKRTRPVASYYIFVALESTPVVLPAIFECLTLYIGDMKSWVFVIC